MRYLSVLLFCVASSSAASVVRTTHAFSLFNGGVRQGFAGQATAEVPPSPHVEASVSGSSQGSERVVPAVVGKIADIDVFDPLLIFDPVTKVEKKLAIPERKFRDEKLNLFPLRRKKLPLAAHGVQIKSPLDDVLAEKLGIAKSPLIFLLEMLEKLKLSLQDIVDFPKELILGKLSLFDSGGVPCDDSCNESPPPAPSCPETCDSDCSSSC